MYMDAYVQTLYEIKYDSNMKEDTGYVGRLFGQNHQPIVQIKPKLHEVFMWSPENSWPCDN